MSIQSVQTTQLGPIIRGSVEQESRRAADSAQHLSTKRQSLHALAASDSFEPSPSQPTETRADAQLRRVAAQQQASYLAPQPAPPSETSGVFTDELLTTHPTPTQPTPTPPANPVPLPGVVETPIDSPNVVPIGPGQDAPPAAPESPAPEAPPTKSRTFNADDLAQLQSIFGKTAGQKGFDTSYDLNSDGVINGADLANLLARFERPATKSPDAPSTDQPVKLTSQSLLDGVLKHLGGKVQGDNGVYDVNSDGAINGADIAHVLSQWDGSAPAENGSGSAPTTSRTLNALLSSIGSVAGDSSFSRALDLNGDGAINGADLADYLASLQDTEETA